MYNIFKRLIDLLISLTVVVVFSPIYLLLSCALAFDFKGNPFFTQKRNGLKGKEFRVIKFRTMTNERNAYGELLPNKERLTKLGMFVRLTSLDELPQLFNIICGDMSFIGPRPLPIHYFPFFEGVELERFSVRPGISGLAQVNGRNHLQWDKRIDLDVQYVRNYGFLQDLEILRKTIIKVVKSEDIAVDPTQVMIDFDVYKKSLKRNGRKLLVSTYIWVREISCKCS